MVDLISEIEPEDNSSEQLFKGRSYIPPEALWDDLIDMHLLRRRLGIDLIRTDYDSYAVRKCFACLEVLATKDSIYCISCSYKRNRRISVKIS
jgi:hypothetical protein